MLKGISKEFTTMQGTEALWRLNYMHGSHADILGILFTSFK